MKYFAKYFPVEGRINDEGSNVMFFINGEWTEPCDFDSLLGAGIEKIAGGVLFLCSHDIQVGDEVNVHWNDGVVTKEVVEQSNHWLSTELVYKVIGEILTLGIKEGQEFDDKTVDYLTIKS